MKWVLVEDEMINLDKIRNMWVELSRDQKYYVVGGFDDDTRVVLSIGFECEDECADYMVSLGET